MTLGTNPLDSWNKGVTALASKRSQFFSSSHVQWFQLAQLKRCYLPSQGILPSMFGCSNYLVMKLLSDNATATVARRETCTTHVRAGESIWTWKDMKQKNDKDRVQRSRTSRQY